MLVDRFKDKAKKTTTDSKEVIYNLEELRKEGEEINSPWPELDDQGMTFTRVKKVKERYDQRGSLADIGTWTMAGIMGAITTYAISVGNERLLMTLLATAAVFLTRVTVKEILQLRGRHNGTIGNRQNPKSGRSRNDDADDG